jgi:multidrug efflux system outer membrane protein
MSVRYEQTVQTALTEVEDALVTRAKASEREAAMKRRVGALEEIGKLARVRYTGGQASYLEVLDADKMVYEAQGREAQSRGDTMLALIGIYKAMGGGWMVEQERRRTPAQPVPVAQVPDVIESRAQQ